MPQKRSHSAYLSGLAGAGRYVWNELLARNKRAYEEWKKAGEPEGGKPNSPTFFTLGKQFTRMRNEEGHEWLKEFPFAVVRLSSAKRLGEAYAKFFAGQAAFPRFKARRGDDSFAMPEARVRDGRLYIPKLGEWLVLRRKGGDPYAGEGECRQAVVKRELGKWYAYVTWRVGVAPLSRTPFHLGQPRRCVVAARAGRYPREYRERLVELARAGRSPGSLAREFEPSEQTIRNWVGRAELDEGERSDGLTTEARGEMSRLKRENKRLRMERDILKKAAAWFARESGSIPNGGTRS